jgi:arylsulfatase A
MKRINFHKKAIVFLLTFVCIVSGSYFSLLNATPRGKPNIVFILIDDLGWKDLECTGSQYYKTPHINQLANEGLLFTRAYASAPVCSPSRGAIFSGQYPARTKLTDVFSNQAKPSDSLQQMDHDIKIEAGVKYQGAAHRWALHPDQITFAEVMQQDGYKTGYLGKWHCGWDSTQWPNKQGFEFAEGYRLIPTWTKGHWGRYYIPPLAKEIPGLSEDEYMSDALTRRAEEFIAKNTENPFLLVVSHYLVHAPLQGKPEKIQKWENVPTTDQSVPTMAAMIESVDESVGRIMAALKRNGLEDNTVVIFTSDNGGYDLATSTYPLLGSKAMPYEGGYRVPFIMKWPDHIRCGEKESTPTMQIDLYPTILELADVTPDPAQHLDGVSLYAVLAGTDSLPERPIFFHFPHYSGVGCGPFSAVLYQNWKLYRYYNDDAGAYHLFNLNSDPFEQNDRSHIDTERVRQFSIMLKNWLTETDAQMPIRNPNYNADTIQNYTRDNIYGSSAKIRREQEQKLKGKNK